MRTRTSGRARGALAGALLAGWLGLVSGCGPQAGEPGPPGGPEAASARDLTPASGRCFTGELAVDETFTPPPAGPACERTPESIHWQGRARVELRADPALAAEAGWMLPRSELRWTRVAYTVAQSGFEETCTVAEAAPDLAGRTERRVTRRVEPASRAAVTTSDAAAVAGTLYHAAPPRVSPQGRVLLEPDAPDRLRPGQVELELPEPCDTFEAPGTRIDGPDRGPSPEGVRCAFGHPLLADFRIGHTLPGPPHQCTDQRRQLEDDGETLRGDARCRIELRDGRRSSYQARWELRATPCPGETAAAPPSATP